MSFFDKLSEGIKKTRESIMGNVNRVLNSFTKIDEDFFEELEETLITCDIGVQTSVDICAELRKKVKTDGIKRPDEIKTALKEIIAEMLGEDKKLDISAKPAVILVIGVNGAGKTTTIGKLAAKYTSEGKKVIVAAADTFRAAAIEQLEVWAERAHAEIVKHSEGSDPASVVFDAVTAAKARGADIVICDTAGRLHNKKNLMDELKKITRICYQQAEGCSVETLLVLDATTGQNAVNQAKLFSEAADITGIVLTKLDGTAKGGIVITINKELGIPVKLIGVGEKVEDLQEFNAEDFAEALFINETDFEGNYERITDSEETEETEESADISESEETEKSEETEEAAKSEEVIETEDNSESEETEETEQNTETDEGKNTETDEGKNSEEQPKKKGKFDFLFREITFGKKKKKKDEDENADNTEDEKT